MREAAAGNALSPMVDSSVGGNYYYYYFFFFYTLGINVPEGGLKKLVKMKRLGMSKIPCGHKRAYYHAEEQR